MPFYVNNLLRNRLTIPILKFHFVDQIICGIYSNLLNPHAVNFSHARSYQSLISLTIFSRDMKIFAGITLADSIVISISSLSITTICATLSSFSNAKF